MLTLPPQPDKKQAYRLKCLRCGHKWLSRCLYGAHLLFHKERSRSGMTDADILARIEEGTLEVDIDRALAYSVLKGRHRLKVITRTKRATYRFVKIGWQGKQKKIALHRLVWLAATRELIPEGFDVNHLGRTDVPEDSYNNLSLLEASVNRANGPECRHEGVPF